MSTVMVLWVVTGWFFLLVVIKGHGGLTNMLATGIGEAREKDVELFSTASRLEQIPITRQIEREAEFQRMTGISPLILVPFFLFLVIVYGVLGLASFGGLFSIPAGANVWGIKF